MQQKVKSSKERSMAAYCERSPKSSPWWFVQQGVQIHLPHCFCVGKNQCPSWLWHRREFEVLNAGPQEMMWSLTTPGSYIHLVLILSSLYFLQGSPDREKVCFWLLFISLFILPPCHFPRHCNKEQFSVHSWLIKHAVQSFPLIDISEPPSNLLYLYLLLFRASVLFDQPWLLSILYILG